MQGTHDPPTRFQVGNRRIPELAARDPKAFGKTDDHITCHLLLVEAWAYATLYGRFLPVMVGSVLGVLDEDDGKHMHYR